MPLAYSEFIGFNALDLYHYVERLPFLEVGEDSAGARLLTTTRDAVKHALQMEYDIPDPDMFRPDPDTLREIKADLHSILHGHSRATFEIATGWQAFIDLRAWRTEHAADALGGAIEDLGITTCAGIARELAERLLDDLIAESEDFLTRMGPDPVNI